MRKEEDMEEKPEDATKVRADKSARKPKVVETDEELEDVALLGESTLAKMNAAADTETKKPAEETTTPTTGTDTQ
jgi:hypothetical protein